MKNKLYLLFAVASVGFTSCQKASYATFQESQSETFARTTKVAPVVKASQVNEATDQIHAFSITTNNSNVVSTEESAAPVAPVEITSVEKVVAPATAVKSVKKAALPVASTSKVSLKDKLISKVLIKRINKLNKKAEKKGSSSLAVATSNLLYLGLGILAIGLLMYLVPVLNVLASIVVAAGAIIAILGIIQRL